MAAGMGGEFWGKMDTCIGLAAILPHSPETITTLLFISYTSIQYKKFFLKQQIKISINVLNNLKHFFPQIVFKILSLYLSILHLRMSLETCFLFSL